MSKTPCAACKTLRRKCTDECVFAPYFPPDQPHRFETVHKVYGASNVAKILSDLHAGDRVDAVSSLVFEAEARLKDPIYGCVGSISILQHKLKHIQTQIQSAKQELATYNPNQQPSSVVPVIGFREQDMLRNLEYQKKQQELSRLNNLFDHARPYGQHDQHLYVHQQQQQQIQHQYRQQSMDLSGFNRRFDGAGYSGQATQCGPYGPNDWNVCQIQPQQPQQEQDHHLQQLMQQQSANDHSSYK